MRTRLWAESDVATVVPWSTLTLLLTDVVDSTGMWDSEPDVMAQAIERHRILIHAAVERHGGVRPVEQGEGDSVVAALSVRVMRCRRRSTLNWLCGPTVGLVRSHCRSNRRSYRRRPGARSRPL